MKELENIETNSMAGGFDYDYQKLIDVVIQLNERLERLERLTQTEIMIQKVQRPEPNTGYTSYWVNTSIYSTNSNFIIKG